MSRDTALWGDRANVVEILKLLSREARGAPRSYLCLCVSFSRSRLCVCPCRSPSLPFLLCSRAETNVRGNMASSPPASPPAIIFASGLLRRLSPTPPAPPAPPHDVVTPDPIPDALLRRCRTVPLEELQQQQQHAVGQLLPTLVASHPLAGHGRLVECDDWLGVVVNAGGRAQVYTLRGRAASVSVDTMADLKAPVRI